MKTFEEVKTIKKKFIDTHWTKNMVSCGIGKLGEEFCISVGLKDSPTEEDKLIPGFFEGVPVKIEVIGEVRAL